MLKLTKYEFRKNITAPIILLVVIGLLEVAFLCSIALNKEDYVALFMSIQTVTMQESV